MKKVIVTRENYEEVMFDLLENNYPKEVRENILDQISADTFLNFEWQQWNKATYSESTEIYKSSEAEFIENLTKEEEKKKGLVYYFIPMAVAASILLFIGLYFFSISNSSDTNPGIVESRENGRTELDNRPNNEDRIIDTVKGNNDTRIVRKSISPNEMEEQIPVQEIHPMPVEDKKDSAVFVAEQKMEKKPEVPTFQDSIRTMIAAAKKQSKYKVTIVEGKADFVENTDFKYNEKRYSMADVLNHKDGITLSKFLQNPNSRIVTDPDTKRVTIEYIAEDHSILVLTLSN
jgi:hypothetical protein